MNISIKPTKESEEAARLKLKKEAEEAGTKAKEILNSIGMKYIIILYKAGGCIKFYKDSKCIKIVGLSDLTNELMVNFTLCHNAFKLKDRKRFKTIEENDFLTEILLDLTYKLENTDNNTSQ